MKTDSGEVEEVSVREHLLRAAIRLEHGAIAGSPGARSTLRPDQVNVFRAAAWYLTDIATRPMVEDAQSFARILQPPRTGKTVVAAHIIGASGLSATFVVPSRTLVHQTCEELRHHLPGVPVGRFDGEETDLVPVGVNVTTYAMLHAQERRGPLPKELSRSPLVFVDEAHHAMTRRRTRIFREAFDPRAIKIGLTATPDYDAQRSLARYFPDLIHEIALTEAMDLGLLAPTRVWIAEVDQDASTVRVTGGDFDAEMMGRLLSSAPAFEAARMFRYHPAERGRRAMIACASRQQAFDLLRFLEKHRPPESPVPRLLLGETSRAMREDALAEFERGTCDTLIQVGVLIEGWTSLRCKILIDLAPSISRVRATQKYFRAMTRNGNEEAHIFVLLPLKLPTPPVLPTDILCPVGEYACGDLVRAREKNSQNSNAVVRLYDHTPVEGVSLRQRMLVSTVFAKPHLERGDWKAIVKVLSSCEQFRFEAMPTLDRFRWMVFKNERFEGHGAFLLKWLGYRASGEGYLAFLREICPGIDSKSLISDFASLPSDDWCSKDAEHLLSAIRKGDGTTDLRLGIAEGHRALTGLPDAPSPSAEQLEREEMRNWVLLTAITALPTKRRAIIGSRFGLGILANLTFNDIGEDLSLSRSSIQQQERKALEAVRDTMAKLEYYCTGEDSEASLKQADTAIGPGPNLARLSSSFVGNVVAELTQIEQAAGDLDWLDEIALKHRRSRQTRVPKDVDGWVEEIARVLQYAARVEQDKDGDYELAALFAAAIVRSCIHRVRPRITNRQLHQLLLEIPSNLLVDQKENGEALSLAEPFATWYLDTHAAFELVDKKSAIAVKSAVHELGPSIVNLPVGEPWHSAHAQMTISATDAGKIRSL